MIGGLRFRKSRKDFIAEKIFGSAFIGETIAPLGRIEKIKNSSLLNNALYQSEIPSCVTCSATWLNMFDSFQEGNEVELSWPFLYALAKKYPGGTSPQDVLNILRFTGQTKDDVLSQKSFWDTDGSLLTAENILNETRALATQYQIASYVFYRNLDRQSIFSALKINPIIIGVMVDPWSWQSQTVIRPGMKSFAHAIVLVDVDAEGNWIVVSWDKRETLDVRVLDKEYPLEMAIAIRDLPDNIDKNSVRRGFSLIDSLKSLCSS